MVAFDAFSSAVSLPRNSMFCIPAFQQPQMGSLEAPLCPGLWILPQHLPFTITVFSPWIFRLIQRLALRRRHPARFPSESPQKICHTRQSCDTAAVYSLRTFCVGCAFSKVSRSLIAVTTFLFRRFLYPRRSLVFFHLSTSLFRPDCAINS